MTTTNVIDSFTGEYAFLSNFYTSPIVLPEWHPARGKEAATVEHAFQSAKTKSRHEVTPLREDQDEGSLWIMLLLLRLKFAPGSELARRLIATAPADLIEGNTWGDRYWGVCDGVGENHLGQLLMQVRTELAAEIIHDMLGQRAREE